MTKVYNPLTNDWTLREEAKLYDIETWQAEEFVQRMQSGRGRRPEAQVDAPYKGTGAPFGTGKEASPDEEGAESHVSLSESEVSEWMDLFGPSDPVAKRPPKVERRPPSPSRAAFSRDRDSLRKRLKGKQGKR